MIVAYILRHRVIELQDLVELVVLFRRVAIQKRKDRLVHESDDLLLFGCVISITKPKGAVTPCDIGQQKSIGILFEQFGKERGPCFSRIDSAGFLTAKDGVDQTAIVFGALIAERFSFVGLRHGVING